MFFLFLTTGCFLSTTKSADLSGHYNFTHVDGQSGLSENMVKSILQDSWGFVWLGTKNGLNRYDGFNIKQYNVDDPKKNIGNHNISALFEAPDHHIWVGTDKGVFIYSPYTEQFSFFDVKTPHGDIVTNWISQIGRAHV